MKRENVFTNLNSKMLLMNNFPGLLAGFQLVTWEFPYYGRETFVIQLYTCMYVQTWTKVTSLHGCAPALRRGKGRDRMYSTHVRRAAKNVPSPARAPALAVCFGTRKQERLHEELVPMKLQTAVVLFLSQ